ncbi:threonine/homoserine/homoserine lactone efflux protein [Agrobacterium tumefaciens]|uniref:LysE family translocator n=1 Tax=Agrobacterium tumefaciens TaxID=358 RepID=UPI000B40385B|nr:LysE family translocator [Agrobacterium tumefaciens]MBP2510357.1 threonine/homoserine/homoserine lactone efflux protein [Agrobacterium tumefaciens]MBP2519065.1 threonine/homoserine/homoserine lactone efflux protein [Agrobacterium tumefaciens]MBP2577210.1 threonine/homoserine/homoserine lactone efflux protein [Agrobacterium tumefaciens]MBP2596422.1 threonine/homoserine/homoserine lactone efflux protein [Agrobacterium tumefaciens]NSY04562.1 LysE family translocator [Agrobacterium tumefaciens]
MDLIIPSTANLSLFVSATLVLLLVPGPAVLYIFARSVEQGRSAGLVSILGIHSATLVHVVAAAVGLSALLASSALAFSVVKYAGATYLIWLGLKKLFGPSDLPDIEGVVPARSRMRIFREGFIVNLLNPKTALFFLAFLPQFVEVDRGHVAMQVAFLGILYTAIGVLTDGAYALAAGTAGNWLKRSPVYLKAERWVSGFVYIGLGMTAALSGNHKK